MDSPAGSSTISRRSSWRFSAHGYPHDENSDFPASSVPETWFVVDTDLLEHFIRLVLRQNMFTHQVVWS